MRPIRTLMTTLLVTGMASFGYARPPAPVAAQTFSALSLSNAVGSILQQDEQKPKDTPDSKPANAGKDEQKPKDTPEVKPSKTEKQEKPTTQQQPDKAQKDQDQKQDKSMAKQDQKDQHPNQTQDRNMANQDQQAANGHEANGRRVPDKDLKAHFGQEHKFSARQVVTTTRIVPNQTQFVYTGYTFVFADPWPEGWAMDDDCYIDYVDGEYFLFDVDHPGVRIALTIVG